MRILSDSNNNIVSTKNLTQLSPSTDGSINSEKHGQITNEKVKSVAIDSIQQTPQLDNNDETKAKVQEAVKKLNEMLVVNNSTSKFMYHDGLDRYYVTVVDRETEEVVKEIPPKKLLDSFYEMQKMLGMIVDERI